MNPKAFIILKYDNKRKDLNQGSITRQNYLNRIIFIRDRPCKPEKLRIFLTKNKLKETSKVTDTVENKKWRCEEETRVV